MLQSAGGIVHRCFVQRILQLCHSIAHQVDTVVIALVQHIVMKQRFYLPETIPQGELIQGKVLKILHKFAAEETACGKFRHLGQLSALGISIVRFRAKPQAQRQSGPQDD